MIVLLALRFFAACPFSRSSFCSGLRTLGWEHGDRFFAFYTNFGKHILALCPGSSRCRNCPSAEYRTECVGWRPFSLRTPFAGNRLFGLVLRYRSIPGCDGPGAGGCDVWTDYVRAFASCSQPFRTVSYLSIPVFVDARDSDGRIASAPKRNIAQGARGTRSPRSRTHSGSRQRQ